MRRLVLAYLFVCGLLVLPRFIFASIVINEIAWMGSLPKAGETASAAAGNEWMELANIGGEPVDLTGWILGAQDGTPRIEFSGTIATGGFFLLERTNDDTIPGVSADQLYTGAISNSGEFLSLRNAAGAAVDSVDASTGWPAGDNTTKDTMQRSGSGWITAAPTPRAQNAGATTPPPPAGPPPASIPYSVAALPPPPSLRVEAGEDRTALAGAVVEFRGQVFGLNSELIENARMLWNFGDGSTREGKAVTHIFPFPGTYVVSLAGSSGEYTGSDYFTLRVVAAEILISEINPGGDGFVELFNAAAEQLDLGGIRLIDGSVKTFSIPMNTLIKAKTTFVLPNALTGFIPISPLALRDAGGRLIEEMSFGSGIPAGASWERSGEGFIVQVTPTPGRFTGLAGEPKILSSPPSIPSSPPPPRVAVSGNGEAGRIATASPPAMTNGTSDQDKPRTLASILAANFFLAASIILGLAAAAGFIVVKRRLS